MQGNTRGKYIGAIISAVIILLIMVMVVLGFAKIFFGDESMFLNSIMLVYILLGCAVVIGVLVALKQRIKELNSGEEEEAKKY